MSVKENLRVGYLPILDHLTLGIADHNEASDLKHFVLQSTPFSNWKGIAEALKENRLDAAFLLFPLALKMYRENPDISLVLLGHREGQVLVTDDSIDNVKELKGKTIQIPDLYSTHHILLYEILKQAGLNIEDVTLKIGYEDIRHATDEGIVNNVSGLIIAELLGTDFRKRKGGKFLSLSQDFHPHHIDCVLVVKNALIQQRSEAVQELVESLVKAGAFINAYPRQAAEIGESFLGWPKNLLYETLTHNESHISFWDLLPRIEDFEELQKIAVDSLKLWDSEINLNTFVNADFATNAYRSLVIGVRREVKDKGQVRTVPGSMHQASKKLDDTFDTHIPLVGMVFITAGQKYPAGIQREKELHINEELVERVFGEHEIAIESSKADVKGIAFTNTHNPVDPDRAVIKLNRSQAEQCLKALSFGANMYTLEDASNSLEEIADNTNPVVVVEYHDGIILSLKYDVFRLMTLCLVYFK